MSRVDKSAELLNAIVRSDRKLARKLILDEGVEITGVPQQSLHVFLKIAVESRDAVLVRKLLELKPDLSSAYGARILWIVAEDGDTEIASMLVRAGANVNINTPYKPNFLHLFATSKNPRKIELAVLMMEHGANLTIENINGYTTLRCAIQHENFIFARELLKKNAPLERPDVYETIFSSNTLEWIMLFIEEYPDHDTTRSERIASIFSWLCEVDFNENKITNWLNALLEVEVPDISVIYKAVMCGKNTLVKSLLDSRRIDENQKMMLLHPAMILKTSSMAEMLIEWGADVNYRLEVTVHPFPADILPIHVACACQSTENIKFLLRHGADINDAPDPNYSPFLIMLRVETNLNDANRVIIKHLALLTAKGIKLNEKDLQMINENPYMQKFYEECRKELEDMKKLKVLNRFVVYSIFTANIKELSLLTKRREFAKYCDRDLLKLLFPLHCEELNLRIAEAKTRRDLLSPTENSLYDTLGHTLPDLVIDKIMLHLYYSDIYLKVK